jgi:hypothetical protein
VTPIGAAMRRHGSGGSFAVVARACGAGCQT